ncbi:MAG: glycogen/starch/alpha-glucan phosphorylase [Clostridiales bacterium]|nr:glycogen/starch/alpha-glucan phosphorylase [Clostridiales bacterium]
MEKSRIVPRTKEILMARYHKELKDALPYQLHDALSLSVMHYIAPKWVADYNRQRSGRCAYYLSAEFLLGRMVYNNLFSLGVLDDVKKELRDEGVDIECMEDVEDAALGNGGLGRLAACFLDSAATINANVMGYGLYYQYGLFKQYFEDFKQKEKPDDWTKHGDPWSLRREDEAVIVTMRDFSVSAVPYDMPVIGYEGKNIGTLRMWKCESLKDIDFELFNQQKYASAAQEKNKAEDITKLLYPNDTQREGRMLRLRQQYVLCSASLQDMLRNFKAVHGNDFAQFPKYNAAQLNDTHPTMSIPELIRLLGKEGVGFEDALAICRGTFSYTNHTIMQEALEKWDMDLMEELNPELAAIIKQISNRQERELDQMGIQDRRALSIFQGNTIHMAYLAMYGGNAVNGVAEIHSNILKDDVLHEWYKLKPEMFQNKTNGITQRRWLGLCNPELSALIEKHIGKGFLTDLDELKKLRPIIESDESLWQDFVKVKGEKKRQLSEYLRKHEGVDIPAHFVFDVQVKRLHEYKRQLLNAFSIMAMYQKMKDGDLKDMPATAFIFGAKSAAGYDRAKAIIRYINQIAHKVNNDPETNDRLRVVFVQNYNCSYAERIIPAADISEQISPAGTEASGTGNMKLMLNGAVTLGTYDGANIEIVEQAGVENNFIFGADLKRINEIKDHYNAQDYYHGNAVLKRAVDTLVDGTFADEDGRLRELHNALIYGAAWHRADHYYHLLDFESYLNTKLRAIYETRDAKLFAKKCLYNVAGAGKFSSDRTIRQYADEIWHV